MAAVGHPKGHLGTDRASRYRLGSTVVANRGCRVRGSHRADRPARRVRGGSRAADRPARRVRGGSRAADRPARRVRGSRRAVDRPVRGGSQAVHRPARRVRGSRPVADHLDRRVVDRQVRESRRVAVDHRDHRVRAAAEVRPGHIVSVETVCIQVRRSQRLIPD